MGGHEEVKISSLASLPHAHKNISENMKLDYVGVDAFLCFRKFYGGFKKCI